MALMAVREFECVLCQAHFTLLSGDLIVPETLICDECLAELWPLQGDALMERISGRLVERTPQQAALEKRIAQHIEWLRQRWTSADEVIQNRELQRQAQG